MMEPVFVLLVTIFFNNGLVEAKTVISHSQLDCVSVMPFVVYDYQSGSLKTSFPGMTIKSIQGRCIEIKSETI